MKKMLAFGLCVLFLFLSVLPSGAAETLYAEPEPPALLTVSTDVSLNVKAKAYALMDVNTGTLLAGNNENERLYPASVTKIMTLLLVAEALNEGKLSFDEVLTCSDTAAAKGGSQIWLEPGEEMTVRELLKAAAIYSANDACALLGEAVAGSEEAFVTLMNSKAEQLGMSNTHFDNCTGLDDDTTTHLTTAYDIALMSRELIRVDFIREYTTIWMDELRDGKTQLVNTNRLIRNYPGATGLKTGTTGKAGCCVSATAERNGLGLIAVVLGADNSNDRFNGARTLLDYGFANYEIFRPDIDTSALGEVRVLHGEAQSVPLYIDPPRDLLVSKGMGAGITEKAELTQETEAPVHRGQILGSYALYAQGQPIAVYDIAAAYDVNKLTFFSALKRIFRSLCGTEP